MVYFSVIWSKKLAEFIRHIYNFSNFVLGEFARIKKSRNYASMKKKTVNEKREVVKDLFVLWIALAALGCAAVNLHISLNMLGRKEYLE